jgi:hypothetical protein
MSGFWKIVLGIVIAALLVYAGYYAYTNWWGDSQTDKTIGRVRGVAVEAVEGAKDTFSEVKKTTGKKISDFIKEKTGEVVSSIGDSISNFGNSISGGSSETSQYTNMNNSSFGSVLPQGEYATTTAMATGSNFILPPPFTTIITKTNSPLVFSINREVSYSIDWADGVVEKGSVPTDRSTLISHEWKKQGNYAVIFTITDSKESRTHIFPVRVYN